MTELLQWADEGARSGGEHQLGERIDEGVDAVGAAAFGEAFGAEVAHLVFQCRECTREPTAFVTATIGSHALTVYLQP